MENNLDKKMKEMKRMNNSMEKRQFLKINCIILILPKHSFSAFGIYPAIQEHYV